MRGATLRPPCSCFQSPEIHGEKNDTRTAGLGLLEKGRGGRGERGEGEGREGRERGERGCTNTTNPDE